MKPNCRRPDSSSLRRRWLRVAVLGAVVMLSAGVSASSELDDLVAAANVQLIPPGPEIPLEIAAWAGRWTGRWAIQEALSADVALVIERIVAITPGVYTAHVVYLRGPYPGARAVTERHEGRLTATTLTLQGQRQLTFTREGDVITGRPTFGRGASTAVLTRGLH